MEFSRQEYWSGLPFPNPGDLPNPGIEPASHCTSCTSRWVLYHCTTWEAPYVLATQSQFLHPISGVHMPLVLFMGLPGVVLSGSTLTWLESGEWIR